MKISPLLCVALLVAWSGFGCSSFQREYKATASRPHEPNQIVGVWWGRWQDDAQIEGGPLRAIVKHTDPNTFVAYFEAVYNKDWKYSHRTTLAGTFAGSTFHFEGRESLGWMAGGEYTFSGYATPEELFCTYDSPKHRGTYTLRRIVPTAGASLSAAE